MGDVHGFKGVTDHMLIDMEQRFGFMVNTRDPKFDPIYLLATALKPCHRLFISDEQAIVLRRDLKKVLTEIVSIVSTRQQQHCFVCFS